VRFEQQGILERLDAGEVVLGDGGFLFELEKRGYVKAGPYTPEAAAEHPEAGRPPPATMIFYRCKCVVRIQSLNSVIRFYSLHTRAFSDGMVSWCDHLGALLYHPAGGARATEPQRQNIPGLVSAAGRLHRGEISHNYNALIH